MNHFRLMLPVISLAFIAGCDKSPDDNFSGVSKGLINKGIMSNAEVNAYKLGTDKTFIARTYTNTDGTFEFEELNHNGPLYIEVTTTSQTLATCDAVLGCGTFSNGLKLPGENDQNLDGNVDFGDQHYYNDQLFILTAVFNFDEEQSQNGSVAVTPLTHLAAQSIVDKGLTSGSDIDAANEEIAELFGMFGADISQIVPPDVTDADKMAAANDFEKLYALIAAAVASAVIDGSKSLVDVINEITTDYLASGLIGNSATPTKITLESLMTDADAVALKVSTDFSVDMNTAASIAAAVLELSTSVVADQEVVSSLDFDGDGLSNEFEAEIGTNPLLDDTDEDGVSDYDEYNAGTDPLYNDGD